MSAFASHRHRWEPGPASPDSTVLTLGCAICGVPKPIRWRVVDGRLLCLDCGKELAGWRTDFTGHWRGSHMCAARIPA